MDVKTQTCGLSLTYPVKLYQVQNLLLCCLIQRERYYFKDMVCVCVRMRSWGRGQGSILVQLPMGSWCSPDAEVFQKSTYELVLIMDPCGIKHNQWENICDVEIIFQSLVSLSMWLFFFSFHQGSEFLNQQSSLASTAERAMLQNISREFFEKTITIAKGNSSLGKFLIFYTYFHNQIPHKEEKLNRFWYFGL